MTLSVALPSRADTSAGLAVPLPTLPYTPDNPMPVEVGANMLFATDPDHALSIEDVLSQAPDWQPIERASPNFGFTNIAHWFTFAIDNQTDSVQRILLELPIPFLDDVRIYRVSGTDLLEQQIVGDRLPFSERPVRHQNLVMPFDLDPGSNRMVARVSTAGTVEAPLFIWSTEAFAIANGDDRLLQGIWFGVMGIMVFYNLFLYALLKDLSYLYYVAFTISYLMFQACLKGYGFAYMWPNQIYWNSFAISVFIASSNLFGMLMVISFLDLKNQSPRLFRLMAVVTAFDALLLILTFIIPYTDTVRINSALAFVTCMLSILIGYSNWYHGNRDAKYFCLAWTSAFGGVGILVAAKFGVLPANFWTNNAGQIGVLMLVALLSFALANRFNREKELRLYAQESALTHEKLARKSQDELLRSRLDANKKLERKVAQRTENLENAMQELESMNRKLEIMSTTDALTNLHNRGHFENCLQAEFKRAIRHQRPLSIILSDVDFFKRVNDSYGHKAGDACLQAVARVLQQRISRPGDLVARYGGEEFIVLLADTTLEQARGIAQSLLEGLRTMQFEYAGKLISVTASFGVSTLNNVGVVSADQLVTQADLSLYQAKHNGRDQVVCWDTNRNGPEQNPVENTAQA